MACAWQAESFVCHSMGFVCLEPGRLTRLMEMYLPPLSPQVIVVVEFF